MPPDPEKNDPLKNVVRGSSEINTLLEEQSVSELTRLHPPIERFANLLARPQFIITCLVLFALWIGFNTELIATHSKPWDKPPFYWLQGLIAISSLLVTTTVLVSQSRQGKLADQRSKVQLQIVMLIGQRTAKLIELNQELRRDLPDVQDRRDEQADVLQQQMKPDTMLEILEVDNAQD